MHSSQTWGQVTIRGSTATVVLVSSIALGYRFLAVSPYFRRCFALLMLLCMPFQALAALDEVVCAEQGYGDSGVAASGNAVVAGGDHEQIDLGGLTFDSCALCHLGAAPMAVVLVSDTTLALTCEFASSLDAACIEHDPSLLKRPPRFPLA